MDTTYKDIIITDPSIMMGKPVINGTRITVEQILEKVAEGESFQQIKTEHPQLKVEQIKAALEYAAMIYKNDEVYSLGA
mgnify:CR=1 FL=1